MVSPSRISASGTCSVACSELMTLQFVAVVGWVCHHLEDSPANGTGQYELAGAPPPQLCQIIVLVAAGRPSSMWSSAKCIRPAGSHQLVTGRLKTSRAADSDCDATKVTVRRCQPDQHPVGARGRRLDRFALTLRLGEEACNFTSCHGLSRGDRRTRGLEPRRRVIHACAVPAFVGMRPCEQS